MGNRKAGNIACGGDVMIEDENQDICLGCQYEQCPLYKTIWCPLAPQIIPVPPPRWGCPKTLLEKNGGMGRRGKVRRKLEE